MPEKQEALPAVEAAFVAAWQHHLAGRSSEAEPLYRQVLEANSSHADCLHLYGVLAYQTGRFELAAEMIDAAIASRPQAASFRSNLGTVLRAQGRLNEAAATYQAALELQPDLGEAITNLGLVLGELGRFDEAIGLNRRAIDLQLNLATAHNNLGDVLWKQGRLDEAVACFRTALKLKPDSVEAHCNLGAALYHQGRLDEAVDCYRAGLKLKPDFAEAHFPLATALLARGDMAEGWKEFEWRYRTQEGINNHRNAALPQWRGEAAEGRTLLIHAEGGLGDTLQFCRYAPLASAKGLRVIMAVQAPVARLLRSLPGVDLVVGDGEEVPGFDLFCPMLSMPFALGTTLATVPNAPSYLHADAAQVSAWRTRLAGLGDESPRIGLAWAGNPRKDSPALAAIDSRRSFAPDRLAPLLDLPGLRFFSLQKDGPKAPEDFPLTDYMDEMGDFADTAALIANLDLVISVDTAVAHLAAALGKPVWLLERFDSCWRWLAGRRDSPWYPTLHLYRQPHPGYWDPVLAEVSRDLRSRPWCGQSHRGGQ